MKEVIPFSMIRHHDETGKSGCGEVLSGVVMPSGKVMTEWTVPPYANGIYNSLADFLAIHVFAHPTNETEIRMGASEPLQQESII